MNEVYLRQAGLLMNVLPEVARESRKANSTRQEQLDGVQRTG